MIEVTTPHGLDNEQNIVVPVSFELNIGKNLAPGQVVDINQPMTYLAMRIAGMEDEDILRLPFVLCEMENHHFEGGLDFESPYNEGKEAMVLDFDPDLPVVRLRTVVHEAKHAADLFHMGGRDAVFSEKTRLHRKTIATVGALATGAIYSLGLSVFEHNQVSVFMGTLLYTDVTLSWSYILEYLFRPHEIRARQAEKTVKDHNIIVGFDDMQLPEKPSKLNLLGKLARASILPNFKL